MRFHFRPERGQWENVRDRSLPTLEQQLDKEIGDKLGVSVLRGTKVK